MNINVSRNINKVKDRTLLYVPVGFILTFIVVLPTYYCNYLFTCLSLLPELWVLGWQGCHILLFTRQAFNKWQ